LGGGRRRTEHEYGAEHETIQQSTGEACSRHEDLVLGDYDTAF
jgi:hypothetical protein